MGEPDGIRTRNFPPWTARDSNTVPPVCKTGALPGELAAQVLPRGFPIAIRRTSSLTESGSRGLVHQVPPGDLIPVARLMGRARGFRCQGMAPLASSDTLWSCQSSGTFTLDCGVVLARVPGFEPGSPVLETGDCPAATHLACSGDTG
jgi:hypothetical protein